MPTLGDALALDRDDPLAWVRDEFIIAGDDVIYADGNSLGRLARATRDALQRTIEDGWGTGLIGSWGEWLDLPFVAGDRLATTMLGAAAGTSVIADSTTVNFYKLAAGALAAQAPRRVVITDAANFPTNRFVLAGLAADVVVLEEQPSAEALERALGPRAGEVALVTFSHVDYRSGARLDMAGITRAAHAAGALALWDLSHSAGAVEVDLAAAEVDLAVGCTYKYLNAGPGAPAFLYVRAELHERVPNPIQGWFGAADQFAMGPAYLPAPGLRRYLSGTTPVLGVTAVDASVELLARAGIGNLAAKGASLTEFLIACADASLAADGFEVVTPRRAQLRGAHIALAHGDAWRVCQALARHGGVVADFREPNILRIGLAPAYSRFVDAFAVVERLQRIVRARVHESMPETRARVT